MCVAYIFKIRFIFFAHLLVIVVSELLRSLEVLSLVHDLLSLFFILYRFEIHPSQFIAFAGKFSRAIVRPHATGYR